MKIRQGFVSNSSSSSFCIIGVSGSGWIEQLAEAEGLYFEAFEREMKPKIRMIRGCNCNINTSKGKYCSECGKKIWIEEEIEVPEKEYSYCGYGVCPGKVVDFYGDFEPYYAGVEAKKLLDKMSIPEAKKEFQNLIKSKYNIEIPLSQINFHYGEVGSG